MSLLLLGYQPSLAIPPVSQNQVLAQNIQTEDIKAEAMPPMDLPHPGYLSTRFSKQHPGIDLASGLGMPVRPVTDGLVEAVNFSFWGLGNYVTVAHNKGYQSIYGHMGKIYVKKGQYVTKNNILGEVGMTGWTSGPHTHLEIYKDGKAIDPLNILPKPNFQ